MGRSRAVGSTPAGNKLRVYQLTDPTGAAMVGEAFIAVEAVVDAVDASQPTVSALFIGQHGEVSRRYP